MCRCALDCDLIDKLAYFSFYLGGHVSVPLSLRQLSYIKHPKKVYFIENVFVVLLQLLYPDLSLHTDISDNDVRNAFHEVLSPDTYKTHCLIIRQWSNETAGF
jgi:hypothetical protein